MSGTPGTGAVEAGDGLGAVVALGDFNGDGRDDALIGAPGEDIGAIVDAGFVIELFANLGSISDNGTWIYQGGAYMDAPEAGDAFG